MAEKHLNALFSVINHVEMNKETTAKRDTVPCTCDPSPEEAESQRSGVQVQPCLPSDRVSQKAKQSKTTEPPHYITINPLVIKMK